MNRFFVDPQAITDPLVQFPEDIGHQILHVLRLQSGEKVKVLDNSGLIYLVRLEMDPGSTTVRGRIIDRQMTDTEPDVAVDLYFGLTHREKMEWILQKGTEIGVRSFRPFISSRTLVQKVDLNPKRQARWKKIIREAAEQSHRGKLPILHPVQNFSDCLLFTDFHDRLALIAWVGCDPGEGQLKSKLAAFSGASIALFVGPEGGFSEKEIDRAKSAGCQVVSLGRRILRMETAAIVFPALVLYALHEE